MAYFHIIVWIYIHDVIELSKGTAQNISVCGYGDIQVKGIVKTSSSHFVTLGFLEVCDYFINIKNSETSVNILINKHLCLGYICIPKEVKCICILKL